MKHRPGLGTCCGCSECEKKRALVASIMERNPDVDLRDLHEDLRPFVLEERTKRFPTNTPHGGASSPTFKKGEGLYEDGEDSPWHENAVHELEDGA